MFSFITTISSLINVHNNSRTQCQFIFKRNAYYSRIHQYLKVPITIHVIKFLQLMLFIVHKCYQI